LKLGGVPVGRRAAKREATREQIMEAAARLFRERGYAATTVDEIAEAADVAKGTFYYHFASKDQLMVDLVRDTLGQVGMRAVEALHGGARPVSALRNFVVELGRWAEQNRHLVSSPLTLSLGPGQPGEAREGQASFRRLLADLLAAGQQAGEIRSDADPVELGQILAMSFMQALVAGLADPQGPMVVPRVERNFQLFLEGAAPREESHG
jgi:TetR/AcrR family transcriptional regulator, cholesterol catabolism regulator